MSGLNSWVEILYQQLICNHNWPLGKGLKWGVIELHIDSSQKWDGVCSIEDSASNSSQRLHLYEHLQWLAWHSEKHRKSWTPTNNYPRTSKLIENIGILHNAETHAGGSKRSPKWPHWHLGLDLSPFKMKCVHLQNEIPLNLANNLFPVVETSFSQLVFMISVSFLCCHYC